MNIVRSFTRRSIEFVQSTLQWFLSLSRLKQGGAVALVLTALVSASHLLGGEKKEVVVSDAVRAVEVVNVGDLSSASVPLSLVGLVSSVTEATIRAESGGTVTALYKKLGDTVGAGQIVGTFENASERAALQQAEGAYEQAKTARDIAKVNNTSTGDSLGDVKQGALTAIASAYVAMDDAIRAKTDAAISNPRTSRPMVNALLTDQSLKFKIESARVVLEDVLKNREARNRALSVSGDLDSELSTVLTELNQVKFYLDDFAKAYAGAISNEVISQAQIETQKATIGGARGSIITTISSVTAARQSLRAGETSNTIANGGATSLSDASNDAAVKIAYGAYNAALARYEKTVIRSPIYGTINSLSIKRGDYATPGQMVAVISNNRALEVVTTISEQDARRVTVGAAATLDGTIPGIVTRVAPALDPLTKKIEVKIGISDTNSGLVNGQSVSITIGGAKKKPIKTAGPIKIPLSAVKITPQGSYVFTVDAAEKLVSQAVTTGEIIGEDIQIVNGITADTNIVKDARGLKEDMTVTTTN